MVLRVLLIDKGGERARALEETLSVFGYADVFRSETGNLAAAVEIP